MQKQGAETFEQTSAWIFPGTFPSMLDSTISNPLIPIAPGVNNLLALYFRIPLISFHIIHRRVPESLPRCNKIIAKKVVEISRYIAGDYISAGGECICQ